MAYDVFVFEHYRVPTGLRLQPSPLIVDLGGNVGYTCLYWLNIYPECHVIVVEPHPIHARQIRKNLSLNNEIQRVTLIEAAAATSHGTASLENRGASSRITAQADNEETIPVGLVDFFDTCGDKPIDILKMDIEGSEYEILADNRLEGLSVKAIILEWHQHGLGCAKLVQEKAYQARIRGARDFRRTRAWYALGRQGRDFSQPCRGLIGTRR